MCEGLIGTLPHAGWQDSFGVRPRASNANRMAAAGLRGIGTVGCRRDRHRYDKLTGSAKGGRTPRAGSATPSIEGKRHWRSALPPDDRQTPHALARYPLKSRRHRCRLRSSSVAVAPNPADDIGARRIIVGTDGYVTGTPGNEVSTWGNEGSSRGNDVYPAGNVVGAGANDVAVERSATDLSRRSGESRCRVGEARRLRRHPPNAPKRSFRRRPHARLPEGRVTRYGRSPARVGSRAAVKKTG